MATPRRLRIQDPQGFSLGALFVACGLATLLLASPLPAGTATDMGPGWLPRALGGALAAVGLAVAIGALRVEGPRLAWREPLAPLAWLVAATLAFGALVERAGLVAAMVACVAFATFAERDRSLRETLVLWVALPAACGAIFVLGLGVRLRAWPWSP